jgi:hypothetical protein
VCLFNPGQASPSAVADLQGVPAETDKIREFLNLFCHQTWKISDDWRYGPLASNVEPKQVDDAARAIERGFRRLGSTSTYFPCHRVVLSLSETDKIASGIPESALVIEGPNGTSSYTLSLFDLGSGRGNRTWGELLQCGMAQGTRRALPPRPQGGTLPANQGLYARRRQEPGRGAALPSDPLQHRSRTRSRAGVGRYRRDLPAAPLRDHRPYARAACPGRHRKCRRTSSKARGSLSPAASHRWRSSIRAVRSANSNLGPVLNYTIPKRLVA